MSRFYGKENNFFGYLSTFKQKYSVLFNPSLKELIQTQILQTPPRLYVLYYQTLKQLLAANLERKIDINKNIIIYCNEKFNNSTFLSDDLVLSKCESFFDIKLSDINKEKVFLMNKFTNEGFFNILEKIKILGLDKFFYLSEINYKTDPIYIIYSHYPILKNNNFTKAFLGETLRFFLNTGINFPLMLLIFTEKYKNNKL